MQVYEILNGDAVGESMTIIESYFNSKIGKGEGTYERRKEKFGANRSIYSDEK